MVLSTMLYSYRIFIAIFDETSTDNWIFHNTLNDAPDFQLYITSFYFIITTLVTVGYGDFAAISVVEKVVCICLMLLGVVSFSYTTGALASILSSYDTHEALMK